LILRRTLLVALLLGCPTLGWSHESRPVYVEISEVRTDVFSVHWKVPTSLPASNIPEPVLPSDCVRDGEFFALDSADAYLRRQLYRCPGGLANRKVGIEFPAANPSVSCLFRVSRLSGESFTKLLNPGETSWVIPEQETRLRVAGEYTYLGILHILEGIDHLLFLVCLLIVAATWRRILITITGFTIAHSVTLILSALELVRIPVPPVEATIALSIVFLATEIAKNSHDSLTYRYPITVSSSFGLLHGFGFAAVLKEIGLPQTEIPTSLLFFNVGVEVGQILFVGGLMLVFGVLSLALRPATAGAVSPAATAVPSATHPALERVAAYVVGGLASLWLVERVASFWR